MGYVVGTQHVALTANGTTEGYLTIANTVGFPVGVIIYVGGTALPSVQCVVTENTTTTIRVRKTPNYTFGPIPYPTGYRAPQYGGGSDMSAYTTAANAYVDIEQQVAPGRTSP
jgi:hypothetical protein